MMLIDLTGRVFGTWTVLNRVESKTTKHVQYLARCACGTESVVKSQHLREGNSKSCFKCRRASLIEEHTSHGMSDDAVYAVWCEMKRRCRNPRSSQFHYYGGRGIAVDERWNDFATFWSDMKDGYRPGLELDRIDNDGPYSRENCRWTTRKVQTRNTRRNRIIDTPKGRMCAIEAAEACGIKYKVLLWRHKRGWPPERLFDPISQKHSRSQARLGAM